MAKKATDSLLEHLQELHKRPRVYFSSCCKANLDLSNMVGEDEIGNLVRARCLECGSACKVAWRNDAGLENHPYTGEISYEEDDRNEDS